MSNKYDAAVLQEPQLGVCGLERGEVLGTEVGVQVPGFDTRELGQVVDDLLLGRDVVVDEGGSFQYTLPKIHKIVAHYRRCIDCRLQVQHPAVNPLKKKTLLVLTNAQKKLPSLFIAIVISFFVYSFSPVFNSSLVFFLKLRKNNFTRLASSGQVGKPLQHVFHSTQAKGRG